VNTNDTNWGKLRDRWNNLKPKHHEEKKKLTLDLKHLVEETREKKGRCTKGDKSTKERKTKNGKRFKLGGSKFTESCEGVSG